MLSNVKVIHSRWHSIKSSAIRWEQAEACLGATNLNTPGMIQIQRSDRGSTDSGKTDHMVSVPSEVGLPTVMAGIEG
jgi:hypothetical protein